MLQTEKMEYENYFVLVLRNMKLPKYHSMVYVSEKVNDVSKEEFVK